MKSLHWMWQLCLLGMVRMVVNQRASDVHCFCHLWCCHSQAKLEGHMGHISSCGQSEVMNVLQAVVLLPSTSGEKVWRSTVSPSPLSTCFTGRRSLHHRYRHVSRCGAWLSRKGASSQLHCTEHSSEDGSNVVNEHPPAIVTSHLLWCSPCSLGLAFDPQHLDISRKSQPAKSQSSCLGEKLRHVPAFLPVVLQKNRKDPDVFRYIHSSKVTGATFNGCCP